MLKVEINKEPLAKKVRARDLKPLQIGVIAGGMGDDNGALIMRTQNVNRVEIMNLSKPEPDMCWAHAPDFEVRLLGAGESITLTQTED